jgi:hypothetical protein
MFRRRTSDQPISRGQALVEFALVLPILALLLVVAIDFGRVFFGWVSLTNAARIGANYAGYTPNMMSNPALRDDYGTLIEEAVTGCNLTPADTSDPQYDPQYTDVDGDGKDNGMGDEVTVNISCEFDLITPLAEALFSDMVAMQAEAVFPMRSGAFTGPGGGGTPPEPPCTLKLIPDLLNRTVLDARLKWAAEGFDALLFLDPASSPDDYLVKTQTFVPAAVVQQCVDPTGQAVTITTAAPPPCPAGQAQVPDLIGDLVSAAKLEWTAAGFTGAFKPAGADNSKTVLTQVTDPVTSPPINGCLQIDGEVFVTFGDPPPDPCIIPNMIGDTFADASAEWSLAGFDTALGLITGNSSGRAIEQVPTHPGVVSCTVPGKVKMKP